MTFLTLTNDRTGLDGFPAGFTLVAHDDLGDPLAVDGKGVVHVFAHGHGDWSHKFQAFASVEAMHRYVAFQSRLEIPHDMDLEALKQRKLELEAFSKEMKGSNYARQQISESVSEVRDRIADLRFAASKRGRSIAERHAVGTLCEQALRDAGAPEGWMVRPHLDKPKAVLVVGTFAPPWDEARVVEVLRSVAGSYELVCFKKP
jgi:hypothetical protein